MFDTLFGADDAADGRFFIAFVVVLALIGANRFCWCAASEPSVWAPVAARGRQPRLAVIDAASVDGRRRLVLIRRDNVEHLADDRRTHRLVVEANIVRAAGRHATPYRCARRPRRTHCRAPSAWRRSRWPAAARRRPFPRHPHRRLAPTSARPQMSLRMAGRDRNSPMPPGPPRARRVGADRRAGLQSNSRERRSAARDHAHAAPMPEPSRASRRHAAATI